MKAEEVAAATTGEGNKEGIKIGAALYKRHAQGGTMPGPRHPILGLTRDTWPLYPA